MKITDFFDCDGDGPRRSHIASYLEPKDMASLTKTCKRWLEVRESCFTEIANSHGMIPEKLPVGVSTYQMMKTMYPGSIGPQFYRKYFRVRLENVPPIPARFIEVALRLHPSDIRILLYIPPSLPGVVIPEESRLLHTPLGPIKSVTRPIQISDVPVNIRNIHWLMRCGGLKEGNPVDNELNFLPTDFLNKGVGEGYWVHIKTDPIFLQKSLEDQQINLPEHGLEFASPLEYSLAQLFTYVRSKEYLNECLYARVRSSLPNHVFNGINYNFPNISWGLSFNYIPRLHYKWGTPEGNKNIGAAVKTSSQPAVLTTRRRTRSETDPLRNTRIKLARK